MRYRYLMLFSLLGLCFFINACATILTVASSPLEKVVLDEGRDIGKRVSTNYHLLEGSTICTLMQQPYCMETAEEILISKKRVHGVIPAIIEIPLYGLGLVDFVTAYGYANHSKKEEKRGVVETGSIIECGPFRPAVNTELVIQSSETGMLKSAKTDSSGVIEVKKLFAGFLENSQINIFVREDNGFAYITTLDNSFDKEKRYSLK